MNPNISVSIQAINIDTIDVNGYQRDKSQNQVDKIVSKFNLAEWDLPRVIDQNNGRYEVVNGQHRVEAARSMRNDGTWPFNSTPGILEVQVVNGLNGAKEAAGLFLRDARNKKELSPFDKQRAGIVYDEPMALDIQAALNAFGVPLVHRTNGKDGSQFSSVGALGSVWKNAQRSGHSAATVYHVIRLASYWNPEDVFRFNTLVIKGLGDVVLDCLRLSDGNPSGLKKVERYVKKYGAFNTFTFAGKWAAQHNMSNTRVMPFAQAIRGRLG